MPTDPYGYYSIMEKFSFENTANRGNPIDIKMFTTQEGTQSLHKVQGAVYPVKNGYGAYGVLWEKDDEVQCHICGEWHSMLGKHINAKHGITAEEYKKIFGFSSRTGLVSRKCAANRTKSAKRRNKKHHNVEKMKRALKKNGRKKRNHQEPTLQSLNARGACDIQIRQRALKAILAIGVENISMKSLMNYDKSLFHLIKSYYGSLNEFRIAFGLPSKKDLRMQKVIREIRDYYKRNGMRPRLSELNVCHASVVADFGSYHRAIYASGLDTIISDPEMKLNTMLAHLEQYEQSRMEA